jgi:hypothetical protein
MGGVVAGMGSGAIFKGSLGTVMMIADPDHRAESLAGLLLAGYLGLSVPAIGMGVALRQVSPKVTLLGFSLVVAAALIAAAPALLRADRSGNIAGPAAAHQATVPISTPVGSPAPAPEPLRETDMEPASAQRHRSPVETTQVS